MICWHFIQLLLQQGSYAKLGIYVCLAFPTPVSVENNFLSFGSFNLLLQTLKSLWWDQYHILLCSDRETDTQELLGSCIDNVGVLLLVKYTQADTFEDTLLSCFPHLLSRCLRPPPCLSEVIPLSICICLCVCLCESCQHREKHSVFDGTPRSSLIFPIDFSLAFLFALPGDGMSQLVPASKGECER